MLPLPVSYGFPAAIESWRSAMNEIAAGFAQIAVTAGAVVMEVYRTGATVRTKKDASPVCEADERAEALIHAALSTFVPGVPILAEEAASRGEIPDVDGRFVLVDPVDGTKEFIGRNGEFTVNIALIEHGVPVAGAVYAPALETLWFAGEQAFMCTIAPGGDLGTMTAIRPIQSRAAPRDGVTVMASRSHSDPETDAFLARFHVADRRNAGSSLKFCALAEGKADLYPRFGPTMEWDTAAGDAVLRAAGGVVLSPTGERFVYGKSSEEFRNGGFVAWGRRADAERLVAQERKQPSAPSVFTSR